MPWSRSATRWQNIQQEACSDAAVIKGVVVVVVVVILIVVVVILYIVIPILTVITLIVIAIIKIEIIVIVKICMVIIVIVVYCRVVVPQKLQLQQSCAALGPNSNKAGCLKKFVRALGVCP